MLRTVPGAELREETDMEGQLAKIYLFDVKRGKDNELSWLLSRKLCNSGWRPRNFDVSPNSGGWAVFDRLTESTP